LTCGASLHARRGRKLGELANLNCFVHVIQTCRWRPMSSQSHTSSVRPSCWDLGEVRLHSRTSSSYDWGRTRA
jgi:hypothetical protein